MSLRVVFDTNVLFSATGWRGNPAKCVELAQAKQIQGLTCAEILEELSEKLSLKLGLSDEKIGVVIASLLSILEVVAISGTMTGVQADPKDDKILECAVVGNATHIVTGDRKHLLPLQEFRGVKIVTAADLLKLAQSPAE